MLLLIVFFQYVKWTVFFFFFVHFAQLVHYDSAKTICKMWMAGVTYALFLSRFRFFLNIFVWPGRGLGCLLGTQASVSQCHTFCVMRDWTIGLHSPGMGTGGVPLILLTLDIWAMDIFSTSDCQSWSLTGLGMPPKAVFCKMSINQLKFRNLFYLQTCSVGSQLGIMMTQNFVILVFFKFQFRLLPSML